jgi:hypothetical protein
LSIMKDTGIKTGGNFMSFNVWEGADGIEFENRKDSLNTLRYVQRLLDQEKIDYFIWSVTTPYPGSPLFDIAVRYKLIPERYLEDWEYYDSGNNYVLKLPGIERKDMNDVFRAGKKMQMRVFFKNRLFRLKTVPLYIRKLYYYIKLLFRTT